MHPLTQAFYLEFEKLLPEERKAAIEEERRGRLAELPGIVASIRARS